MREFVATDVAVGLRKKVGGSSRRLLRRKVEEFNIARRAPKDYLRLS